jgi:hypothetical protein
LQKTAYRQTEKILFAPVQEYCEQPEITELSGTAGERQETKACTDKDKGYAM